MERVLVAKVRSEYEFVSTFLMLMNGMLQLTPSEIKVLTEFVLTHYQMAKEGADEEEIGELLFSDEYRQLIADKLSNEKTMTKANLTAYLKVLVNKRLIHNTTYGFGIDKKLIPVERFTIKYIKEYEDH